MKKGQGESRAHALLGCIWRGTATTYSMLIGNGYLRSRYCMRAVDGSGDPIPWFSYPAIEWLRRSVKPWWTICEYGVGQSTIWFAERCAVRGIDINKNWADYARWNSIGAKEIICEPDKEKYIRFARGDETLVVIDGDWRHECARHVAEVRPAMVLVDNSDVHIDAVTLLRDAYEIFIPFVGFSAGYKESETALFINPKKREPAPTGEQSVAEKLIEKRMEDGFIKIDGGMI